MDTSEVDCSQTNGIVVSNSEGENICPEPVNVDEPKELKSITTMKQVSRRGSSGVASDAGLRTLGQSRRMSSKQRELEMQLAIDNEGTDETQENTDFSSGTRYSARQFVRCSSQDIVDHDSGSSETSETQSAPPTNIYEMKGLPPPRRMSQSGGNRIRSATGKLIDQYAKDMTVKKDAKDGAEISKPRQSIKSTREKFNSIDVQPDHIAKQLTMDREKELDEVRSTIRRRTLAGEAVVDDDGEEVEMRKRLNSASSVANDIKCRKSLVNIREKLLTRANSQKNYKTDQSVVEETKSSDRIERIRNDLQQAGKTTEKTQPSPVLKASIDNARSFYKTIENKPAEKILFSKPTVRRKTAEEVMANRRKATYGKDDDHERQRSNSILDTNSIDFENVRAARAEYKRRESAAADFAPINKPIAKKITDTEVTKTMQLHKQRSESQSQVHREHKVDLEDAEVNVVPKDQIGSQGVSEESNDLSNENAAENNVSDEVNHSDEGIENINPLEIKHIIEGQCAVMNNALETEAASNDKAYEISNGKAVNQNEIKGSEFINDYVIDQDSQLKINEINNDSGISIDNDHPENDHTKLTNGQAFDSNKADLVLVDTECFHTRKEIVQKEVAEIEYQEANNNNNAVLDTEPSKTKTEFQQQQIFEMI